MHLLVLSAVPFKSVLANFQEMETIFFEISLFGFGSEKVQWQGSDVIMSRIWADLELLDLFF